MNLHLWMWNFANRINTFIMKYISQVQVREGEILQVQVREGEISQVQVCEGEIS